LDLYHLSITLYKLTDKHVLAASREARLIWRCLFVLSNLLSFGEAGFFRHKFDPLVKVLKQGLSLLPPKSRKPLSNVIQWLIPERTLGKPKRITVIPKHYFEKLGTIEFYGMTFNIPFDVEGYLELHYGKDWRTPKRKWDWEKEDGTVKEAQQAIKHIQ
jgi:hypothetical protein